MADTANTFTSLGPILKNTYSKDKQKKIRFIDLLKKLKPKKEI